MRQWGWRAYLLAGAVLAVAYYLVPPDLARLGIWPVVGFSSAAAIVVGVRRNRPGRPLPWYLFAVGQVLLALGDTLDAARTRASHAGGAFPSAADGLYLGFYLLLAAGLLLLARDRSAGRDTATLIDATIVSTGLALLGWVFLIVPQLHDPGAGTFQRVAAIVYLLADVVVLAVAVRLAVGAGRRPPAWAMLIAGVLALIVGDALAGLLQAAGTWRPGGPVDLAWIAFFVGFGAAALHPSMTGLPGPAPVSIRLPRSRLALITCASLVAPAALVIQSVRNEPLDVPVIAAGSAVLFLLALARMSGLAAEVALQQERKRAMQPVLRGTEAERSRLAAELHDGPVQQLTALLYGLELARHHVRASSPASTDELLASLEEKASGEINELRRLLTELRPPVLDELGLVSALRGQGRSFESSNGVPVAVRAEAGLELAPELETVLYRVTQESLANVSKHANASKVNILLAAVDRHVRLLIHDDGVGFDPQRAAAMISEGHFGLTNMRERVEMVGGKLLVDSSPGRGTTIAVEMNRRIPSR